MKFTLLFVASLVSVVSAAPLQGKCHHKHRSHASVDSFSAAAALYPTPTATYTPRYTPTVNPYPTSYPPLAALIDTTVPIVYMDYYEPQPALNNYGLPPQAASVVATPTPTLPCTATPQAAVIETTPCTLEPQAAKMVKATPSCTETPQAAVLSKSAPCTELPFAAAATTTSKPVIPTYAFSNAYRSNPSVQN